MAADFDALAGDSCRARALVELQRLGYRSIAPDAFAAERDSLRQVLLIDRVLASLQRLNPGLSETNLHRALRELGGQPVSDLRQANRRTHALLTDGLLVDHNGGSRRARSVRYLDFDNPANNDFVVTWELPVRGVRRQVVLDLVVFVNGIPLVVLECAPQQLGQAELLWQVAALTRLLHHQEAEVRAADLGVPRLFESVHLIVALAEQSAVYGSVLTPPHGYVGWSAPWPHTTEQLAALLVRPPAAPDVLLHGMLSPRNLLELLRDFVSYPAEQRTHCLAAEYVAAQRILRAPDQGGLVWHASSPAGRRQLLLMEWLIRRLRRDTARSSRTILAVVEQEEDRLQLVRLLGSSAAGTIILTTQEASASLLSVPPLRSVDAGSLLLFAGALESTSAELFRRLRDALPQVAVIGLTTTPSLEPEPEAGSYLSSYTFPDALADQAAVPVFVEPRELASYQTGRTESERIRTICQALSDHFRRVARPDGGTACLLAPSAQSARAYKQTLHLLHPDIASAVVVRCEPLRGEATPSLQVIYAAAPLRGRALLLAALSVSCPGPHKRYGLIVDYTGGADYELGLQLGALSLPEEQLPHLQQSYQAAVCRLSAAQNLYSLEQCLDELRDPTTRREFAACVHQCADCLEILFDSTAAQGFLREVEWLGQVVEAAAVRYADELLQVPIRGARVRRLVEQTLHREPRVAVRAPAAQPSEALPGKTRAVYEALLAAEAHPSYGPRGDSALLELAAELAELSNASPQPGLRTLLQRRLAAAGYPIEQAASLAAQLAARNELRSP